MVNNTELDITQAQMVRKDKESGKMEKESNG
jgi:hypothetical protein